MREHRCAAGHKHDVGDVESRKAGCVRGEERDCWRDRVGKHVTGVDVQMAQQWEVRSGWVARDRLEWDADTRRVEAERQVCQVGHGSVRDAFEDAADQFGADDDRQGAEGLRGKKQYLPE